MPLPPAPASATAFLTEIGIRPFSPNTKHKAALCKLGPSCFLSATNPAGGARAPTSRAAHRPKRRLSGQPRPRSPLPRRPHQPGTGRKVTSLPASDRACAGAPRRPPEAAGPRFLRGGPTRAATAPAPGSLRTSLPRRAEPTRAAEIAVQPARRRRRPRPGLSQAGRPPSGSAPTGGGGGEPRTPPGSGGGGPLADGGRRGKFQNRGPAATGQRRSGLRDPGYQPRAEGRAAPCSAGDQCLRRSATSPRPSP